MSKSENEAAVERLQTAVVQLQLAVHVLIDFLDENERKEFFHKYAEYERELNEEISGERQSTRGSTL